MLDMRIVDMIHTRLLVRYGSAWINLWTGLEIKDVKDDWARVLEGVQPQGVRYALDNLPPDRPPPTAEAFRALCNRRPEQFKALPYKAVRNPEKAREVKERLAAALADKKRYRNRVDEKLDRLESVANPSVAQRDAIRDLRRAAEAMKPITFEMKPIANELLPPGMRKGN